MSRKCRKCNRKRGVQFFTPRGRVCFDCQRKSRAQSTRARRVLETYGITLQEYEKLLRYQDGACAGCGGKRRYNLHIDHDHQVERSQGSRASVRGLLCANCNGVLRKVRDDPETLRGLADYLENWPSRGVI